MPFSLSDVPRVANIPEVDPSLLNKEDFECSLCYRLLHLPVTTPCGHVFCRPCLDKVLDHKTECPLCKNGLAEVITLLMSLFLHRKIMEKEIIRTVILPLLNLKFALAIKRIYQLLNLNSSIYHL